jgi:hypothetical protein
MAWTLGSLWAASKPPSIALRQSSYRLTTGISKNPQVESIKQTKNKGINIGLFYHDSGVPGQFPTKLCGNRVFPHKIVYNGAGNNILFNHGQRLDRMKKEQQK